jgi:hypothetical protein
MSKINYQIFTHRRHINRHNVINLVIQYFYESNVHISSKIYCVSLTLHFSNTDE